MGVAVRTDKAGKWRDADGRYASPPAGAGPAPLPNPAGLPPPPPPAEPPPPPPPPAEYPEPDDDDPELGPASSSGEVPPEPPADWAEEPAGSAQEPAAEAPPERPGMSTAELMRQLEVGQLWAAVIRLAATPRGHKPAPITPAEAEKYTGAWAAVADRYFPSIHATELLLLTAVTIGGAKAARSNAIPLDRSPAHEEPAA